MVNVFYQNIARVFPLIVLATCHIEVRFYALGMLVVRWCDISCDVQNTVNLPSNRILLNHVSSIV